MGNSEELYRLYPRHIGKRDAIKAIGKCLVRIALELKLEGMDSCDPVVWLKKRVELFAKSPAGNRGTYTPHPSTWFNGSRYLDDEREWYRDGENRSPVKQSRAREIANNNAAAFAAAMGGPPVDFGTVPHEGANDGGGRIVEGEVKRLLG